MLAPGSKTIMHACLEIGGSKPFLSDHNPPGQSLKGADSSFYVYVADVDAAHKKAKANGMKEIMPPTDMVLEGSHERTQRPVRSQLESGDLQTAA
jgi:uncharacterized glyoxalase superfamily protein PhnB